MQKSSDNKDISETKKCADYGMTWLPRGSELPFLLKKWNFYTKVGKWCKNVKTHALQAPISHQLFGIRKQVNPF